MSQDTVIERECCDRCGESLEDGYQLRVFGEIDAQTGYADEIAICSACIDKENDLKEDRREEDEFYEAGDEKYHFAHEEEGF